MSDSAVAVPGTRTVHVGRQALYDRSGKIAGYELLFRGQAAEERASEQGAYATSQVIVNAFAEFGVDQLCGGRLGFVNVTREFLVGELPLPFTPDQAVLEVVKSVEVDDTVLAGVAELVADGYAIALDDFVFSNSTAKLLDLATYVKIDTLNVAPQALAAVATSCRGRPNLKLIAERVENDASIAVVQKLGFDLMQGYALSRPQVVSAIALQPSRLRLVRLLAMLDDPDAEIEDVAEIVNTDPALSLRLLRAANSAAAATSQRIESVRHAAVLIGFNRLRQWLTLMAVSDLSASEDHLSSIMIRARFCQEIAGRLGLGTDSAFTAGLLDAVCDLFPEPREKIVSQLPLTEDLLAALVNGAGPLADVIAVARAYESDDAAKVNPFAVPSEDLTFAYLDSIRWAEGVLAAFSGATED